MSFRRTLLLVALSLTTVIRAEVKIDQDPNVSFAKRKFNHVVIIKKGDSLKRVEEGVLEVGRPEEAIKAFARSTTSADAIIMIYPIEDFTNDQIRILIKTSIQQKTPIIGATYKGKIFPGSLVTFIGNKKTVNPRLKKFFSIDID